MLQKSAVSIDYMHLKAHVQLENFEEVFTNDPEVHISLMGLAICEVMIML